MSVEIIESRKEFEQSLPREIERKYLPVFPEALDDLRAEALPIEQYYLSHPSEPFSLRMREVCNPDGSVDYTATLKDRGTLTQDGLDRLEVTAPVSRELYEFYRDASVPVLRKLRAEPEPGVVVNFYDNGSTHVESEDGISWQRFVMKYGDAFVDITGDHLVDNEWHAHLNFRRANNGHEAHAPLPDLRVDDIIRDIYQSGGNLSRCVVHIGGRSGSGKSTIVRELRERLAEFGLSTVVTSTDDYHRGTKWLVDYNGGETWTHWDDRVVYDTATMATELAKLRDGQPINKREIDWQIAEPIVTGITEPADVIIVEGIYATSPDITAEQDLQYIMPTPLATCIGRRLLRDLRERPQFADPAVSLGYMLREAEPAYRAQSCDKAQGENQ